MTVDCNLLAPKWRSHPLRFAKAFWPSVTLDTEQRQIINSVRDNDETFVPAANKCGKDFITAFIILWFFMTREPCRIVTTSAKDDHLRVLWGEIGWWLNNSILPLTADKGGMLVLIHQEMRKIIDGVQSPISYVRGMVANKQSIAAMGGHHADPKIPDGLPHTLLVCDESSSVPSEYYTTALPWARRVLAIGNTWPCENFFKHAIKGKPGSDKPGGDMPRPGGGFYRKVIRIRVTESANVKYGLKQLAAGIKPDGSIIIPGVKTWDEYQKDLATRDDEWLTVSHNADFYEGASVKMFPQEWLNTSEAIAKNLIGKKRTARAIGADTAAGGDSTAFCAIDEYGVIEIVSKKTPDTSVITSELIAFGTKHLCPPENWMLDLGGGGQEHADRLRAKGYNVRTVAFGSSAKPDPRRGLKTLPERMHEKEEAYAYKDKRAEMYWNLRQRLDPNFSKIMNRDIFSIGWSGQGEQKVFSELRRQLEPIPIKYDEDGRIYLIPKNKPRDDYKGETLTQIIGHSPDELDSLVVALYCMESKPIRRTAGVA